MRLRSISLHWSRLLSSSPNVCQNVDLSLYNRQVTNKVLTDFICPFVGKRAQTIDISNCFHITDEGFASLSSQCGSNVRCWKMKSVWDISANAVLEMANNAKQLEEIDLSNCRKVSDNLLARIVGWVVTEPNPPQASSGRFKHAQQQQSQQVATIPPVGTVVGCPNLKRLTLSYCKHVTDRSMAHLAVHAHARLQSIDLTRCTTITDGGFQHWSIYKFTKLERLILADCTYLTDNAIVYLTNAAKGLQELDLVCIPLPIFLFSSRLYFYLILVPIYHNSHSAARSPTPQPKSSPWAVRSSVPSSSPSVALQSQTPLSAPSGSISLNSKN
jgi:F-box/leucine-rich repeat protein 7